MTYEEVPAWFPDGRFIVFGRVAPGPSDDAEPTLQVFVMNADGSDQRQLTRLAGNNSAPDFSRTGPASRFNGQVGESFAGADIFLMDPDGRNVGNLTQNDEPDWQPNWSPDGEWIVFARGPATRSICGSCG